jgi:hypothetical protein
MIVSTYYNDLSSFNPQSQCHVPLAGLRIQWLTIARPSVFTTLFHPSSVLFPARAAHHPFSFPSLFPFFFRVLFVIHIRLERRMISRAQSESARWLSLPSLLARWSSLREWTIKIKSRFCQTEGLTLTTVLLTLLSTVLRLIFLLCISKVPLSTAHPGFTGLNPPIYPKIGTLALSPLFACVWAGTRS